MPLFAFVQAALNSPELDDEAFFQRGKQINVWISVAALASLALVFFAKFSRLYSLYAILTIGFLAFAFKAPFFQPEILSYSLFGFAFILSLETLFRPKWYKYVGTGALFALAHFTKANVLPALIVFSASHSVLLFVMALNGALNRRRLSRILLSALVPLMTFMILLFPYFRESKLDYGEYFYNVNTRIYIWFDSWDEADAATKEAGGYAGFLQLPDDQIPGLRNYLREHSSDQIIERLREGIEKITGYACYIKHSRHIFGYCSQVALGLLLLLFSIPPLIRQFRWQDKSCHIHIYCYLAAIFAIYGLGAAWYNPISGSEGPRVVLILLIPFFWTIGLMVHSRALQDLHIRLFGYHVKLVDLAYALISVTLFFEIYQVITWRAADMYGGK
ncbi:MAG: hypothetical protein OXG39_04185 [Chloroflexi bacterium]|nr:hypothetical protein [Chloroflexota bacterium]